MSPDPSPAATACLLLPAATAAAAMSPDPSQTAPACLLLPAATAATAMSPDPSPEREFYLLGTQQDPALCMALVSCFLGPASPE